MPVILLPIAVSASRQNDKALCLSKIYESLVSLGRSVLSTHFLSWVRELEADDQVNYYHKWIFY